RNEDKGEKKENKKEEKVEDAEEKEREKEEDKEKVNGMPEKEEDKEKVNGMPEKEEDEKRENDLASISDHSSIAPSIAPSTAPSVVSELSAAGSVATELTVPEPLDTGKIAEVDTRATTPTDKSAFAGGIFDDPMFAPATIPGFDDVGIGAVFDEPTFAPALIAPASTPKPADEKSKSNEEDRFVLRRAYKRYLLRDPLPRVLVCHLKRFQQTGTGMRKIDEWVEFPEHLDLGGFVAPEEDAEDCEVEEEAVKEAVKKAEERRGDGKKSSTKYKLYSVVVHMGSLMGGHYVAYVLSDRVAGGVETVGEKEENGEGKGEDTDIVERARAREACKRREWIYCSDSNVKAASLEEVLGQKAYLLFYERV
ncbi:hypothetical protein BC937DRAFT_94870, partial [Endogone sp. FLAS-F59071]